VSYLAHRQLIEQTLQTKEPRAVVSLNLRDRRWVIVIPIGNGQRITMSFPAHPVDSLELASQFYPRRVLARMVRPWALRAIELGRRACDLRAELAHLG